MLLTVKYKGISTKYSLNQMDSGEISDIKSNVNKNDGATHNGRMLQKEIFSKIRKFLKFESQKNRFRSDAKVALRVQKITLKPLNNTAENRENSVVKINAAMPDSSVVKVSAAMPDPAAQAGIEAAANAKLAFETSVMVINKRLDNIGASINDLARPQAKTESALIATAINDLSGAQAFMKNQADSFMQIANARSPIPEIMENNEASANAGNVSGQSNADAVVKLDRSAMRSMFNSIRADMRDVFIAEAKARPEDKELYIFLTEGLLARLNKTQASMKAAVEAEGVSWDRWLVDDTSQFDLDAGTSAGGARAVVLSQY